jgi:thiazole/oxazole-forming peptide maturase SagD family component
MDLENRDFFSEKQYAERKVPFAPYDPEAPISWLETQSLTEKKSVWVPAQLLVLGYRRRTGEGEPYLCPAFTTGTAAHTIPERSLNSAMLELIQMDAAMGCWYSGRIAREIEPDERLRNLASILHETRGTAYEACFHYLDSPDFKVHIVACILRSRRDEVPATGVGVACEMSLEAACYKAFLEASAIPHLAQMGFLKAPEVLSGADTIDPLAISDLDNNVLYYALPRNLSLLDQRFSRINRIAASDLPQYPQLSEAELTKYLLDQYRQFNKRLYYLELSTPDVRDLGFYVCRTYSPDLLSLSLPSYPPANHPRLRDYGDTVVFDPHPFP